MLHPFEGMVVGRRNSTGCRSKTFSKSRQRLLSALEIAIIASIQSKIIPKAVGVTHLIEAYKGVEPNNHGQPF